MSRKRTRSRSRTSSRLLAGFALFAVLAASPVVPATAHAATSSGRVIGGTAKSSAAVHLASTAATARTHPATSPRHSGLRLTHPLTAAATGVIALTALAAPAVRLVIPLVSVAALLLACAWFAAYLGTASRTRGQPCVDVLAR